MLSWAVESLIYDGRGMSEIKQGVTLEIFGEGNSMGPVNDRVREEMIKTQGDIHYDVTWKTLGEYLDFLDEARRFAERCVVRRRHDGARECGRVRRRRADAGTARADAGSRARRRCAKARSASAAR